MEVEITKGVDTKILTEAYRLMCIEKSMAELFEENKQVTSKYVHATSRGHEAIQLACAFTLKPQDYVFPYYRDDSILLGIGYTPFDVMLQLLGKASDPFSSGRTYYAHPSSNREDMPKIPHQSSATGMQAIPATGTAQGIKYLEEQGLKSYKSKDAPLVVCSLGDGSITEGEVSEAFQMSVLHKYPIIFLIQDNDWDISAHAREIRAMDAPYFARGFKGMKVKSINGSDFVECYKTMKDVVKRVRFERTPYMVHAKVPLLNHHTSGVRSEWYRHDMEEHKTRDPFPVMHQHMLEAGIDEGQLQQMQEEAETLVKADYERALNEPDTDPGTLMDNIFVPTPITEEKGFRHPEGSEKSVMVDAALHAVDEIMRTVPESLLYGQDVGGELGGVFREAALLAKKYGDKRVFNTPIQEAYIIGSTCGMSAAGCKPIVEVQFADYIWPGLNQLFTEISRSCYLTDGKWPVQTLIRVPIGAYGGGGPYHSSSVESVLLQIKGIKVVYPSNTADMKGLLKAGFYDPNPVVILEHKGLYWSKVPGTKEAMTVEPDEEYVVPIGKGRVALDADAEKQENGESIAVIAYGMGIYWAMNAANNNADLKGCAEVIDLRSLNPVDNELIFETVKKHNKCLVITEEAVSNSFGEALAGRIGRECFENLDAPVELVGSKNSPAVPLSENLEKAMLPNAEIVANAMRKLLEY